MELDNLVIGRNIAKYRILKDRKAHDVADKLGMKEATYTKYERGETAITIDFVQKVATVLDINPLHILANTPGSFVENIQNSAIAIQEHSTFQTVNEQQTQMMIKLMENMVTLSDRLIKLLEEKGSKK